MSKGKSFWEWLFGNSCCSSRGKDYVGREEDEGEAGTKEKRESKNETREVLKVTQSLEDEIEREPGGFLFTEVSLGEDGGYKLPINGERAGEDWVEVE